MERGPMALFGAIVAVGLGPAMWLGAQFGSMGATPTKPPAVTSEHNGVPTQTQDAGQGAGAAPEDPSIVLNTGPKANNKPLRRNPSASTSPSPSARPKSQKPSPDPSSSTKPSGKPSTPPTESTTDPSGGGQGGNPGPGGGGAPPSPPNTDAGANQYPTTPSV
jgi:hypothetical protein